MIDLHTHTTASDGRYSPSELVARAAAAGVTVLAVTDHDTVDGCRTAAAACAPARIEFISGIEITAVREELDLHVLGYFFELDSPELLRFLADQRHLRIDRVRQMIERLATLGIRLDADQILRPALENPGKSAGRPWIANVLVSAGYASTTDEAFDRWLARGRSAFVPRVGASPADVVARIHAAGGIASLAHPGLAARDGWIPGLVEDGLDAIEAYHSKHDAAVTARYLALASTLGIAVSGGSDYHGSDTHGPANPGAVSLPKEAFDRLTARRVVRETPAS